MATNSPLCVVVVLLAAVLTSLDGTLGMPVSLSRVNRFIDGLLSRKGIVKQLVDTAAVCAPIDATHVDGLNLTQEELSLLPEVCWNSNALRTAAVLFEDVETRGIPPGVECEAANWCVWRAHTLRSSQHALCSLGIHKWTTRNGMSDWTQTHIALATSPWSTTFIALLVACVPARQHAFSRRRDVLDFIPGVVQARNNPH